MKDAWPYLIVLALLVGMLTINVRNRRRLAAQQLVQSEQISIGTEVMTTSGLYGTVTVRNEDDTVQLSIAPGVEVKWAIAALRDAAALPDRYRRGIEGGDRPDGTEHGIDGIAGDPHGHDVRDGGNRTA